MDIVTVLIVVIDGTCAALHLMDSLPMFLDRDALGSNQSGTLHMSLQLESYDFISQELRAADDPEF